MATTTISEVTLAEPKLISTPPGLVAKPSGPNKLFSNPNAKHGDFRDDLLRDGFCVVKGAVPREQADRYAEEMYKYVETYKGGLGFKRDDPSTYLVKNMPVINEKGMCLG
jgi:hypothetical protein